MERDPSIEQLLRALSARGYDVCGVASARHHDVEVPPAHRLASDGTPDRLVVVVGHSRGWWHRCLEELEMQPGLLERSDPIDAVTEHMVEDAISVSDSASAFAEGRWGVRYAHHDHPPSMRRLAAQAGLASVGPAGIGAHPRWGPWIALRAVIVTDVTAAPPPVPASPGPCIGCSAPCGPAMEEASRKYPLTADATRVPVDGWRAYAGARLACPVGAEERYDPLQLEYHYTHAREVLRAAITQRGKCSTKKSKTRSSM